MARGMDDLLRQIAAALPQPVEQRTGAAGRAILIGGDPGEVIVTVTSRSVDVAVFQVRWDGPHTPVSSGNSVGRVNWRRLGVEGTVASVQALAKAAAQVRRASYRQCRMCGQINPPEWMHGQDVCQQCASDRLGVTY